MVPLLLFHSTSQDLIGCNQHDTDDESNCKSAYQALSYTCLFDLLRWAGTWGVKCGEGGGENKINECKMNQVLFTERCLIAISK